MDTPTASTQRSPRGSFRRVSSRAEDWIHRYRKRRALRKGKQPTIIPAIGYGGAGWVRVLARVLYLRSEPPAHMQLGSNSHQPRTRVRGWRSFTSVHVPAQEVSVHVGAAHVGDLLSDAGGVIDAVISCDLPSGWQTITLKTPTGDSADCPVFIVDEKVETGILSDIDDTVLNTVMPKPFVAAWNSFVMDQHARLATPGMPVLLDHLVRECPGTPVIYLSTGAWNVAPALSRFFERHLYPLGPMLLTDWGPSHDRWFRSGREHKNRELKRLAEEFPHVKWILIGDDGQHDERIYWDFLQTHASHVKAIVIRQLSTGEAILTGGRSQSAHYDTVNGVPWVYGYDGSQIRKKLIELGVLKKRSTSDSAHTNTAFARQIPQGE